MWKVESWELTSPTKRNRMTEQELPEGCIAHILSYAATPADVATLSLVSKAFASAAEYDTVWDRFIPSDLSSFIPSSSTSKKALYLALSDNPTIIDQGKKVSNYHVIISGKLNSVVLCCIVSLNFLMQSFQLEKQSGNKCYMISARDLHVIWGGTSQYWEWIKLPESRLAFIHFSFSFFCFCIWWKLCREHIYRLEKLQLLYNTLFLFSLHNHSPLGLSLPQNLYQYCEIYFTSHQKKKSMKY